MKLSVLARKGNIDFIPWVVYPFHQGFPAPQTPFLRVKFKLFQDNAIQCFLGQNKGHFIDIIHIFGSDNSF
ncbi:hypothetical protein ES705_20293 [subsurface metagenome]